MAVHHFPLSDCVSESGKPLRLKEPPAKLRVLEAGENVCTAARDEHGYSCDLPDEYSEKLETRRLDAVFTYEPPLTDEAGGEEIPRELISILLVAKRRTGSLV